MIILDEPYASEPLIEWLAASRHPVLGNAFARRLAAKGEALRLVDDREAAARVNDGERVYSNSENALSWILDHAPASDTARVVRLFKDKVAMRQRLSSLNPELFFASYARTDLEAVNVADLPLPVVLKPAVGFCSMGVYVVEREEDWTRALADIEATRSQWGERYPDSVVDADLYLVEGYVDGVEFAIDMYYDGEGRAQVLNVLRHDFAGSEDTSDRLYVTNAALVEEYVPRFGAWLDEANDVVGARNFPVHVEVRVAGDAIVPIEFNPLRFAGLGGTDIAWYAWGVRTYEAFLDDVSVDLAALGEGREGKTYSMSLLNPAPGADLARRFDYEALAQRFGNVLALTRFDVNRTGSYGFLFLETDEESRGELDFVLRSDLTEFLC